MDHNYKKLSDVDVVESIEDSANVLVEVDGVIKKTAKSNVGGGAGGVSSWNDLEDKPFYEEVASVSIFDGDIAMQYPVGEEGDSVHFFDSELNLINGEEYRVVMDGTVNGNPFSFNDVIVCNGELEVNHNLEILKDRVVCWEDEYCFAGHLSIEHEEETVKTLDSKYMGACHVMLLGGNETTCSKTWQELADAWNNNIPIVAHAKCGEEPHNFQKTVEEIEWYGDESSFIFYFDGMQFVVRSDNTCEYGSTE